MPWEIGWGDEAIAPQRNGQLEVFIPLSEGIAESLAFKPKDGYFVVDFSEMRVELTARDQHHQQQVLGYLPIGERETISIPDHIAFQGIRSFVNWRKKLGDDPRITQ